jgi:hypothetical protein
MAETWTENAEKTSATVTGRERQPLRRKLNPLWWFANDEEPLPPANMYVGKPQWLRVTLWYLRNPFQNFGKYVIGVYDKNYTVTGDSPVCATTWLDVPGSTRTGFKRSRIGWRPFVSYVGTRVVWYAGWQWWGFFGLKFNIRNSNVQGF